MASCAAGGEAPGQRHDKTGQAVTSRKLSVHARRAIRGERAAGVEQRAQPSRSAWDRRPASRRRRRPRVGSQSPVIGSAIMPPTPSRQADQRFSSILRIGTGAARSPAQ
jgi:hypothetical protein